jgi:hypothetical protein
MVIGGGCAVMSYELGNKAVVRYGYDWFGHIHTVDFSRDRERLLVASGGFDCVIEFSVSAARVTWEWDAWENGYSLSKLGHRVTRTPQVAEALRREGAEVILVDNPAAWKNFGLPTKHRPVHLNGARYCGGGSSIAMTLFHPGVALLFDRAAGTTREVVTSVLSPHAFQKIPGGNYVLTSTREARFILLDNTFRRYREVSLFGMPGVVRPHELDEWLQSVAPLGRNLFAAVDIRRSKLWLIDVGAGTYRGIAVPTEWAVQEVQRLPKAWAKVDPASFCRAPSAIPLAGPRATSGPMRPAVFM